MVPERIPRSSPISIVNHSGTAGTSTPIRYLPAFEEYISTDLSIEDVAKKYGFPTSTLFGVALREGWVKAKEAFCREIMCEARRQLVRKSARGLVEMIGRHRSMANAMMALAGEAVMRHVTALKEQRGIDSKAISAADAIKMAHLAVSLDRAIQNDIEGRGTGYGAGVQVDVDASEIPESIPDRDAGSKGDGESRAAATLAAVRRILSDADDEPAKALLRMVLEEERRREIEATQVPLKEVEVSQGADPGGKENVNVKGDSVDTFEKNEKKQIDTHGGEG